MGILNLNPDQAKGQLTEVLKKQNPSDYSKFIEEIDWDCSDELKKRIGEKTIYLNTQISVQAAAEIGFSFASASLKTSATVFISDYIRTVTQNKFNGGQNSSNNPVSSVTWGVGFRIAICVAEVHAETKLSLGFLSASAELNAIDTSFAFMSMGMPEEAIPKAITNSGGNFKSEQRLALEQWIAQIDAAIIDDTQIDKISPVMVSAYVIDYEPPTPKAQSSEIYALLSISKNLSYDQALMELKSSENELELVNHISLQDSYKKYLGYPLLGEYPDFSERIPATALINKIPANEWAAKALKDLNQLSLMNKS
jgi:hypothetical protein